MAEINKLLATLEAARICEANESTVDFGNRGLKLESEDDAAEVFAEIRAAASAHNIIFKGNTVGVGAAKKIGEALSTRTEFKRALWSDMFTGRLKAEIPSALIALCSGILTAGAHLVELDLSDNAFGPNGAKGIEGFLRSSSAFSLQVLKLNNNGLGITGGKMIAAALKDCYQFSTDAGTPLKLRVFVGGRNRLENEGATALAQCFKLIGTLEEVSMPQNGIYHVGIAALSDAFAHNTGMRLINLSDNTFTEKGAAAIANVLHAMQDLRIINFDDCLLQPEGGLILAKSLKTTCNRLEELHLNGNEFDTSTGLALIESLSGKEKLNIIEINTNAFGDEGIETINHLAQELNLADALGSFDDDEGSCENDDDDEDGDGDKNETKETEKNISTRIMTEDGTGDTQRPPVNGSVDQANVSPIEKFYIHPDGANLISLEETYPEEMGVLLLERLKNPEDVIGFVFGVASLINDASGDMNAKAKRCCEMLLKQAFESKDHAMLTNTMLEHLGAIKSENEIKKSTNINGVLTMLSTAVTKDWFPASSRSVLAFVLERRKEKVRAEEAKLTELMKSLTLDTSAH